jgi:predicted aspartyl protease
MSCRSIVTMRAVLACAALLGVAGCASGGGNTVCRTDITLEERQNLILAPVSVDGHSVPAILDTGSQSSAVTSGLVTRLGLLSDPRHGSLVSGVGGQGTAQNDALVNRFEMAGYDPGTGHYAVLELPVSAAGATEPLGGLVGDDVLSRFDIDLDVHARRAVLYDPDRCQGTTPDWLAGAVQVPLETSWGTGRVVLSVKLNGKDMRAMLDSGASFSLLDLPAAERLGIAPATLAAEPGGEGFGAAGVNFHRVVHQFQSLEVAGERIDAPKIAVLDRDLREADMLLGLDWLRHHHVLISFRRHILYVARPVGVG